MDEFFRVDDLLNFSNDDHGLSSITSDHYDHQHQQFESTSEHMNHQLKSHFGGNNNLHRFNNNSSFSSGTGLGAAGADSIGAHHFSYDFTDQLYVPNDDVSELEWLSNFVDDSFTDFNTNDLTVTLMSRSHSSIPSAARSKRSRQRTWKASTSLISSSPAPQMDRSRTKSKQGMNSMSEFVDESSSSSSGVRRCSHCASEKTPQWRTGPMGPKTLCNACGVRYKSGRLVPEYRPAASPTFVLTQHSNSHRKVMELRRQKEVTIKQQQQQGHVYHHTHDFQVCR
uniref:GATA transcription factor n=1 Tax=Kalanchoe fedtschenkoi TaxID=63787 RepID=A0A7N0SZ30_KALFE